VRLAVDNIALMQNYNKGLASRCEQLARRLEQHG
jgi:hypothetical protein